MLRGLHRAGDCDAGAGRAERSSGGVGGLENFSGRQFLPLSQRWARLRDTFFRFGFGSAGERVWPRGWDRFCC